MVVSEPGVRRGIVLVTTLLMMVLVVMLVTAVVYTGAGGLSLSGNFYEREAALLAADSGLQYAMTRLQEDAAWRGDAPTTTPAARPDFSVMEKDGNVYGFLSTVYGHRTQFRIKFNYEDGSGGLDGLEDTAETRYVLASPLVSLNNLLGTSAVPLKRAADDGVGPSGREPDYVVPGRTACIIVEGVAGWGVREATSASDGVLEGRSVTRRFVEAYLRLDETGTADSAAYAAGEMSAVLAGNGEFKLDSQNSDDPARVRGLQNVSVSSDEANAKFKAPKDAEIVVGDGRQFLLNGSDGSNKVDVSQSDSSSQFTRLAWNDITRASASSSSDARMRAGTYVWRVDPDTQEPWLEYFDAEWTDESTMPAVGSGTRLDANSITTAGTGVTLDEDLLGLDIGNNVYVSPSDNGARGIAILADDSVAAAGARPVVSFTPPEGSGKAPVLTAAGDVRMQGAAVGLGSITSEGAITLQGPSVLESDPETGVSLYAKGDITLEPTPQQVADSQDQLIDIMSEVLSSSRPEALYEAIVEGDYSGLSSSRAAQLSQASAHLSAKQKAQLQKAWDKAVKSGSEKEMEAFLDRLKDQLVNSDASGADQSLTGVVYTWQNFSARLGSEGSLRMRGTVIAYGGDPGDAMNDAPGTSEGNGRISITARGVELTYDPTYLRQLLSSTNGVRVRRTLWATW